MGMGSRGGGGGRGWGDRKGRGLRSLPRLSAGRTSVLLLHGELLLQGLPELPLPEQLHLQLRLLQLHLLLLSPCVVDGHLEEALCTSHTQMKRERILVSVYRPRNTQRQKRKTGDSGSGSQRETRTLEGSRSCC